jgi:hypothetical protein
MMGAIIKKLDIEKISPLLSPLLKSVSWSPLSVLQFKRSVLISDWPRTAGHNILCPILESINIGYSIFFCTFDVIHFKDHSTYVPLSLNIYSKSTFSLAKKYPGKSFHNFTE